MAFAAVCLCGAVCQAHLNEHFMMQASAGGPVGFVAAFCLCMKCK